MYHKTTKSATVPLLSLCICIIPLNVAAQAQQAPPPSALPAPAAQKQSFKVYNFSGDFSMPGFHQSSPPPQVLARIQSLHDTIQSGEALLKSGDSDGAIKAFQQAVALEPHDGLAIQRLAEAYTAKGQTDQALATYRTLLYPVPGQNWGNSNVNSPTVLSHFALLLLQKGQQSEALTAYQRAAGLLNHEDGKAHALESDLPDLGDGPGQLSYTPQLLLAMVHLAAGIDAPGYDVAELRQAVALAPNSAAAYFYLGKSLYAKQGMYSQTAKVALKKAIQLGDDRTAKAAQSYLQFIR